MRFGDHALPKRAGFEPADAGGSTGRQGAYGATEQLPPVQPQLGAPLHVTVQPPAVQWVMVHVWLPWQVKWQSPPTQSIVHEPPVQSWVQSPSVQLLIVQVASLHVCVQSPCWQLIVQEPPVHV
jgi:hypothetical protein